MKYISVVFPIPVFSEFYYSLHSDLTGIKEGCRVSVPFGNSSRTGYIAKVLEKKPDTSYPVKEIKTVIDSEPLLTPELFKLSGEISCYYAAARGVVLGAMLPISLKPLKREPKLEILPADTTIASEFCLNKDQSKALESFKKEIAEKRGAKFLLHGVAYSGKTEVYMRIISELIKKKKQVLILVPDIAITAQLVKRLKKRFGTKAVGVWHSRISRGKKIKYMNFLKEGRMDILVGSRSAVFVPLKNPGAIIIEEEQDSLYKQENSPRYDARWVAERRCDITGAALILSSATPRIETIYKAQKGIYKYVALPHRVDSSGPPSIDLVDMKREHSEREKSGILSRRIIEKIESNLNAGRQVILFINRRGYTSSVICSACGETFKCPVCNIPYAYHAQQEVMECHWCGRKKTVPQSCPRCKGETYSFRGAGTQKVESVLHKFYPEAKIVRMDIDSLSKKGSAKKIFTDFTNRKYDIMIGTSVIAKGWDFSNVGLVGVINSDLGLMSPDFRAAERIYLTLMQAAGRTGRGSGCGEVVIQTYNPNHYALKSVLLNSPKSFYNKEMDIRKKAGFPPFKELISLTVSAGGTKALDRDILFCRKYLYSKDNKTDILGPAKVFPYRSRGLCRKALLIKAGKDNDSIKESLISMLAENRKLNINIDVDPQKMP